MEKEINPWNNQWSEFICHDSEIYLEVFSNGGVRQSVLSQYQGQQQIGRATQLSVSVTSPFSNNVPNPNASAIGNNSVNTFSNAPDILSELKYALRNQEISNFNNYFPVPFTYSNLLQKDLEEKRHVMLILNDNESNQAICELCDYAKGHTIYLIKSLSLSKVVQEDTAKIRKCIKLLKENLSDEIFENSTEIIDSFTLIKNRSFAASSRKSPRGAHPQQDEEYTFNKEELTNYVVLLWFSYDVSEIESLNDVLIKFDSGFENRLFIDDMKNPLLNDLKDLIKLFIAVTVGLSLFLFSFYPPELWLGEFFNSLLPSFLTSKSIWIFLTENTIFIMACLFLTAFIVFIQIMRKKL